MASLLLHLWLLLAQFCKISVKRVGEEIFLQEEFLVLLPQLQKLRVCLIKIFAKELFRGQFYVKQIVSNVNQLFWWVIGVPRLYFGTFYI